MTTMEPAHLTTLIADWHDFRPKRLYRAIDQFGQVIDVLVGEKLDLAATRRFFTRALDRAPSPIKGILAEPLRE